MGIGILFTSIVLQLLAAGLAVNLVWRSGRRLAWGALAAALALMGVRRSITFWKVVSGHDSRVLDTTTETVALIISLLMLTGVILIGRMFDEEKKKSRILDSSRKLLQQTIDAAPVVITIKDSSLRHVFANRFSAERHGLQPKEFEGKTLAEVLSKVSSSAFIRETTENDERVIFSGEAESFFEETVTVLGKPRHMITSKTPLFGEDSNVEYVLTVAVDVTERKHAEEALRTSEEKRELAVERLRNAIINMYDGFVLYDAKGHLEFYNESFRIFNRYNDADLVPGVTTYSELGEFDKKRSLSVYQPISFELRLAQLLQDGPTNFIQHVDDKIYERHQSATPEGGIIGIIKDVTDQKNAETALIQSREQAEKASAAKSEFLASMSHELRTPMNAILGFTQMLMLDAEHTLTAIQKDYLKDVLQGGNHLLGLINEVLDLAKIEANEIQLNFEAVDVMEVIYDCLSLLEPMRMSLGVEFINNLSDDEPTFLQTDEMRLKQVLLNLFSNATRFNKENGTVTINGTKTSEGFFRISVVDTGQGITDHEQANVFNMFHQVAGNPRIATEGTGIGLYVSKLLIKKMDGVIGFESTVGVGSTFWLELPLCIENKS